VTITRGAVLSAAWLSLSVVAACRTRTDHERAGDRRYAEGAYLDAAAEYRMATRLRHPSTELFAKLGAASLNAGDPAGAVAAYARLAREEPAASAEAADGLVRAARLASEAHDLAALRAAVAELRKLAPLRLPVALAQVSSAGLSAEHDLVGAEAAEIVLAAAAGARTSRAQDSLLVLWGELTTRLERCDASRLAYDAVLRRVGATSSLARAARGGLAICALEAGRAALAVGALDSAVVAFAQAVAIGTPDSVVRMAWLLTGDAWWAAGDTALAAEAYRKATARGDDTNPVVQRAREQLERLLGPAPVP
jgi:tetratricopeptide (TPR) repeat protein